LYDIFRAKELPFLGDNNCTCVKILAVLFFFNRN